MLLFWNASFWGGPGPSPDPLGFPGLRLTLYLLFIHSLLALWAWGGLGRLLPLQSFTSPRLYLSFAGPPKLSQAWSDLNDFLLN